MSNNIDLLLDQGSSFTHTFAAVDAEGNVFSPIGGDAQLQVRRTYGSGSVLIDCSVTNSKLSFDSSTVTLTLLPGDTSGITFNKPNDETLEAVYDLEVRSVDGLVHKPARGAFTLNREVTRGQVYTATLPDPVLLPAYVNDVAAAAGGLAISRYYRKGSTVQQRVGSVRATANVVYPEDYFAVGDGVTDDTNALRRALESGYVVDGGGRSFAIYSNCAPTSLKGLRNITLIEKNPTRSTPRTLYLNGLSGFTLDQVTFDCGGNLAAGSKDTDAGVYISNCSSFSISRSTAKNGGPVSGFSIHGSSYFSLVSCTAADFDYSDPVASDDKIHGFWFDNCNKFTLTACWARNLGLNTSHPTNGPRRFSRGYAFGGCSDYTLTGCWSGFVSQGFDNTGTNGNTRYHYVGCNSYDTQDWGFKCANSSHEADFTACTSTDSGFGGFVVKGMGNVLNPLCRNITFLNCTVINCGSNGVWAASGPRGFLTLTSTDVDDSYPRNITFDTCHVYDFQAVPTTTFAFSNQTHAREPSAVDVAVNDTNKLRNCDCTPNIPFQQGFHFPSAQLTGTGGTALTAGSWLPVNWTTPLDDSSNIHSTSYNRHLVYPKEPGKYMVSGMIRMGTSSVAGMVSLRAVKDGVAVDNSVVTRELSATREVDILLPPMLLTFDSAGGLGLSVGLEVSQTTGANANILNAGSLFTVVKV